MLTRVVAGLTGAVLALGLLGAPSVSSASSASSGAEAHRHKKKKPTVTSSLVSKNIDAHTQGPSVAYQVKRLPKHGSVVLQASVPSTTGWTDFALSTQKSGTLQGGLLPNLGEWPVRVVVRDRRGKQVAKSRTSTVRAFGTVPFAQFAKAPVAGTASIGGQPFTYAARLVSSGVLFQISGFTCSAVSITVGSDSATFRVMDSDRHVVTVPANTLQNVDAFTRPGSSFFYSAAQSVGTGATLYANGSAYCYTFNGQLPGR